MTKKKNESGNPAVIIQDTRYVVNPSSEITENKLDGYSRDKKISSMKKHALRTRTNITTNSILIYQR